MATPEKKTTRKTVKKVIPKAPVLESSKKGRVSIPAPSVDVRPTPAVPEATAATPEGGGSIRVRQHGFETQIDFRNSGEMRKAWNDLAMRIQNGQAVQIGDHIFVGALQASIVSGEIPGTRATRKARRKQLEARRKAAVK